jgi:SagB-type dehydrogenase family enzyme
MTMLDPADTRSLALLFHLNSSPAPGVGAEPGNLWPRIRETRGLEDGLPLPPARRSGVLELIGRRRSCREFAAKALPLGDLSDLLAGAYGLSGSQTLTNGFELDLKAVPSAGGLYPLDFLVLSTHVEGLDDGLYHYDADVHSLVRLADVDRARLEEAILAMPFLRGAAALIFLVAVFDRTLQKYAARGYRYILLEAGHAAQNLCLLAEERGLGELCVGGFVDAGVNEALGLDAQVEGAVYCVGVGYPAATC